MTRFVAVLLAMLLVLGLLGCASGHTRQPGTFTDWERKKIGEKPMTDYSGKPIEGGLFAGTTVPIMQLTGNAYIKLDDGTEVVASCPIQNLKQGNRVMVQQNEDGTWVVTGTQ